MVRRFLCLILVLPVLAGCMPGDNHVDDEKDPHFQQGRNLVNSEDFKGATDEFELALQSNPHSAAAHFELGWLYEKAGDYAAAIYHYQRHIQLQPNSPHAAEVQEHIRGCKQELAKNEFSLPGSQNLQHQVDKLNADNVRLNGENTALHQQVDSLRAELAARPATVTAPQPQAIAPPANAASQATDSTSTPTQTPVTSPHQSQPPTPTVRPKTYIVKEHDTIRGIAARYGVKPSAILSANPRVDPRKLHVGQTLNLP